MTRLSLGSRQDTTVGNGDVIYSDICVPIQTLSIGGKKYFVSFIDKRSGFKDVRLLQRRSELQVQFGYFQLNFERRIERKVKLLYSDNGPEYVGLRKYLAEEGIN